MCQKLEMSDGNIEEVEICLFEKYFAGTEHQMDNIRLNGVIDMLMERLVDVSVNFFGFLSKEHFPEIKYLALFKNLKNILYAGIQWL